MNTWSLNLSRILFGLGFVLVGVGCSTLPSTDHTKHKFPTGAAFVGDVKRPYETLGLVRSRVNFPSLDPVAEESVLCHNFYNKAVKELVDLAKDKGGDAVLDIKSVVFLEDGRTEYYATPECSDDGMEGQILMQGIAVKWKGDEPVVGTSTNSKSRE